MVLTPKVKRGNLSKCLHLKERQEKGDLALVVSSYASQKQIQPPSFRRNAKNRILLLRKESFHVIIRSAHVASQSKKKMN